MQPVSNATLEKYGNDIIDSFKRTCRSQSNTYRQFTMLPSDKQFVRQNYTNPQTLEPYEYILCPDELFASIQKLSLERLNGQELRNFRIITDHIRSKVSSDLEAEMLIKICEPGYNDPVASGIFCWYAYHYAKIADSTNLRSRL